MLGTPRAPHSIVPYSVVIEPDECSEEFGGVHSNDGITFDPLSDGRGERSRGSIPCFTPFLRFIN
jgi:hypothetical protein